jgi:tetratricopeptide (TPR) repeat protein
MKKLIIVSVLFSQFLSVLGNHKLTDKLSDNRKIQYDSVFIEGSRQKILGNFTLAVDLLQSAIVINPSSAASYFQLSQIYTSGNDIPKSLQYARLAVKFDPKNAWYLIHLAKVYAASGKPDSTLIVYSGLVKDNPNNYDYRYNQVMLLMENKKFKKALEASKKLEDDYGFSSDLAFIQYQIYTQLKDNKQCVGVLSRAVRLYPEDVKFYGLLAVKYEILNQKDSALKYYLKLVVIDPNNERGTLSLLEFYLSNGRYAETVNLSKSFFLNKAFSGDEKFSLLIAYLSDKHYFKENQLAIKEFIEIMAGQYNQDSRIYTFRADYDLKTGHLAEARNELIYLVDNFHPDYLVWEQLLYVLSNMGNYEELLKYSGQAITLFKDKPVAFLFYGISSFQLKRYDEALSSLLAGINFVKVKGLYVQFYTYLGETYNARSDFIKSDYYFDKVIELDNINLLVLNNYSYYLALRNDKLDKALTYSRKCILLEPNAPTFLDTYGWVLFKANKLDDAKKNIELAILNGGSKNVEIIEHYTEILVKMNKIEEALKYYKLINELGKASDHIKEVLKIND